MKWYSFNPADTLFFRGAEPMEKGESHMATASFPPFPETIAGAIRTAILIQNNISISDYYDSKVSASILEFMGEPGEKPGFYIMGPFFRQNQEVYLPGPYSWFFCLPNTGQVEKEKTGTYQKGNDSKSVVLRKGSVFNSDLIKTSSGNLVWANGLDADAVPAGNCWLSLNAFKKDAESYTVKPLESFFSIEPRTGIALEQKRSVRSGHLYTFDHYRLHSDVSLVFGVSQELPLADEGILKLGAEQRFGQYATFSDFSLPKSQSDQFMSLSLVEGTPETNEAVIASGKIKYLGGWDMKKGFHKPMKGFFPAGSVFNKKLNDNFIAI